MTNSEYHHSTKTSRDNSRIWYYLEWGRSAGQRIDRRVHLCEAKKRFERRITDYLLKPFTFNRFLQAVNKAQETLSQRSTDKSIDFIFVKPKIA